MYMMPDTATCRRSQWETDRIRKESGSDSTFYHIFTRIRIQIRMFSNTNIKRMSRIRIHIRYLLNLKNYVYQISLLEIYNYEIM
jgi:hypothetical protein